MSGVRVLVGTHKGAFVLTADEKRRAWNVDGPHFGGWDVYHVKGSPADPSRVYTLRTTGCGAQLAARRRRHVPAHDHPGPHQSAADLHGDLGGRRLPK